MVPNARFTELLADIEPSPTTKSNASTAHTNLRAHLRRHDVFKARWVDDFLAGSYSRDTAIRPKTSEDGHERPDVDIIVLTNYTTADQPDDVLNDVCAALEDGYVVERINKRSVRVVTSNAEMDVVPVTEAWGGGYLIPDRDTGQWKTTNPPKHDNWSSEQNTAFDGRFKKMVKMLKWWRRENPTGKRPKGFVLEVLVSLHAPREELHLGEAFATMLENIHASYSPLASVDYKPTISDPAIQANDILAKVTVPQWKAFLEKVRVHAEYARRAQDEEDMEEATRLWRKVFGTRFKTTETAAKAAAFSNFAAAPAPAAGYTFPDVMAAPNTKPRGFA
jgi:hypothetical protein